MTWLRENKRYLVGVVVFVLIIFLALDDFNNRYVSGYLQKKINYMSAEAFQSWLHEMENVKSILDFARTNFDVKEALNYTFAAKRFVNILDWEIEVHRPPDFAEHLYRWITLATLMLDKAVSAIAKKSPTTLRNLSDDTLQKLQNLTATIQNLVDSMGPVEDGVHPVKQLEEKGALSQVIDYAKQIETTSIEIWEIYNLHG